MMILHSRVGLDIAKIASTRAGRVELRKFASRLVDEQTRDLQELVKIQGSFIPPMRFMSGSQEDDPDTAAMIARLRVVSDKEFDVSFLATLSAHHDLAVQLSKNSARFRSADVRSFAHRVAERHAREEKELRIMRRASNVLAGS
jgi:uncharacterized protein (DUF305 family)